MGLEEVGWGDKAWVYLDRHRDTWQAFVNAVMNT